MVEHVRTTPPWNMARNSLQCGALLLLLLLLIPLLQDRIPSGVDLAGHLYLTHHMRELLAQGQISGYDPHWFSGYPSFLLYTPLPYLLALAPWYLFRGAISEALSFNIILIVLPILLLVSGHFAGRVLFGARTASYAFALLVLFLFLPEIYDGLGLGIGALLRSGYFANFAALPLLYIFIAALEWLRRTRGIASLITATLLLATIIATHHLIAITAFLALVAWASVNGIQYFRRCLLVGGAALAATYFIWLPMLRYADLGSGSKFIFPLGLSDPLTGLFPGLFDRYFFDTAAMAVRLIDTNVSWGHLLFEICKAALLILRDIPITGALLFLATLAGLRALIRERRAELPLLYIIGLIFLPRGFIAYQLDLPLHYFRFIQPLFLIQILIAARGLLAIAERIGPRHITVGILLTVIAGAKMLVGAFAAERGFLAGTTRTVRISFLDQTPDYADAMRLIDYIGAQSGNGRILEEKTFENFERLGTLHFFSTMLPLKYQRDMADGMLVESSLSSGFINPSLFHYSRSFRWGRTALTESALFSAQELESMIARMRLFRVEFLITSSAEYAKRLRKLPETILQEEAAGQFGRFALFRLLPRPEPRILEVNTAPYYFVNFAGGGFRGFAESWFVEPRLLDTLIVTKPIGSASLSAEDASRMGGIIIQWPEHTPLDASKLESWRFGAKPLIVLVPGLAQNQPAIPGVTLVPEWGSRRSLATLAELLAPARLVGSEPGEVTTPLGRWSLAIESNKGVFAAYSFAPNWQLRSGQTVYLALPSFLFFFGNGSNELTYGN